MRQETQITKYTWYSTLYIDVKGKGFVKHINRPKCKEAVYHIKAQPDFKIMLIVTENILKIDSDKLSKLNQPEEEKKENLRRFARQRRKEQVYK